MTIGLDMDDDTINRMLLDSSKTTPHFPILHLADVSLCLDNVLMMV